jgi:hypothetical protein
MRGDRLWGTSAKHAWRTRIANIRAQRSAAKCRCAAILANCVGPRPRAPLFLQRPYSRLSFARLADAVRAGVVCLRLARGAQGRCPIRDPRMHPTIKLTGESQQ